MLANLRLALNLLIIVVNTLVHAIPLLLLAVVKLLVPIRAFRNWMSRVLVRIAESWIWVNSTLVTLVAGLGLQVEGLEGLKREGWYLVICNHQSWADIPVLQKVFNRRIPFLKFFLKRELIWVPVIGLAWWALDFPFMTRGKSRGGLQKDLETTRRACEKFKQVPTSVMNFVEGTRATPAKIAQDKGPYQHLLRPKIGGLSVALATMGEQFHGLLDVTVVYPGGIPTFWDMLCGRLDHVIVRVQ